MIHGDGLIDHCRGQKCTGGLSAPFLRQSSPDRLLLTCRCLLGMVDRGRPVVEEGHFGRVSHSVGSPRNSKPLVTEIFLLTPARTSVINCSLLEGKSRRLAREPAQPRSSGVAPAWRAAHRWLFWRRSPQTGQSDFQRAGELFPGR